MKFFLFLLGYVSLAFTAEVVDVGERFSNSKKCKVCHVDIVNDWEKSWHAKSHYKNDEYFRASIDYVSRKTRKSLNSVKVKCATCHNPRISITSTGIDYEIDTVMGLAHDSPVDKALSSETINEGINCVVCHNIDKIHTDQSQNVRGINRVEWTKSGIMSGPYSDAMSPYHKVEHRDFMNEKSNKLCFVCHANDSSESGFVFTNMQEEYIEGDKSCVDCHMGEKQEGIASTFRIDGKTKNREIREHSFAGAHTESMWKDVLSLSLKQVKKNLLLEIENPQPHNIPSGFGSRELILELNYKYKTKVVHTQTVSLTNHYLSKRNKVTIPHLAVSSSKDMSIKAKGKKTLQTDLYEGADSVDVDLYYRLVNSEVRNLLKLKEAIWSQKTLITSKSLRLDI